MSIQDLEPLMETLQLLTSTQDIQDNINLLHADPISSSSNFELPCVKPLPLPPKSKVPKKKRLLKTVEPGSLDTTPGFRAPQTRRAHAAAAAFEAEAGFEPEIKSTAEPELGAIEVDQKVVSEPSKTWRRQSAMPGQAETPPMVTDVDSQGLFKMFDAGWILPTGQGRGGRQPVERAPLLPKKKRRTLDEIAGPSGLSVEEKVEMDVNSGVMSEASASAPAQTGLGQSTNEETETSMGFLSLIPLVRFEAVARIEPSSRAHLRNPSQPTYLSRALVPPYLVLVHTHKQRSQLYLARLAVFLRNVGIAGMKDKQALFVAQRPEYLQRKSPIPQPQVQAAASTSVTPAVAATGTNVHGETVADKKSGHIPLWALFRSVPAAFARPHSPVQLTDREAVLPVAHQPSLHRSFDETSSRITNIQNDLNSPSNPSKLTKERTVSQGPSAMVFQVPRHNAARYPYTTLNSPVASGSRARLDVTIESDTDFEEDWELPDLLGDVGTCDARFDEDGDFHGREWPDLEAEEKAKQKAQKRKKKTDSFIESDSGDDRKLKKKKGELGLLFQVQWYRVILDEAQNIRNRHTKISRSVTDLDTTYRWCLTGTPIINGLVDAHALFYFPRFHPWYDWHEFNGHVSMIEKKNPSHSFLSPSLRRQSNSPWEKPAASTTASSNDAPSPIVASATLADVVNPCKQSNAMPPTAWPAQSISSRTLSRRVHIPVRPIKSGHSSRSTSWSRSPLPPATTHSSFSEAIPPPFSINHRSSRILVDDPIDPIMTAL
ncbi:SNF2 family N-terminal domain-containing protein [Suillus occidentalis]|nr:SNF2 family N-terminal domain-containing protein [Suillus occidentalis]